MYMESRKIVLMSLFTEKKWRRRRKEPPGEHSGGRRGQDPLRAEQPSAPIPLIKGLRRPRGLLPASLQHGDLFSPRRIIQNSSLPDFSWLPLLPGTPCLFLLFWGHGLNLLLRSCGEKCVYQYTMKLSFREDEHALGRRANRCRR